MASSNARRSSERVPLIAILLSAVFLIIMVITIVWAASPSWSGYVLSPHIDNPTQIAIPTR